MRSGATYPSVSGQPPHFARQYALPAAMSASRASCSLRLRMNTTFEGRASAITFLSSFPLTHVLQYGFATALSRKSTPPRASAIGTVKAGDCKAQSAPLQVYSTGNVVTIQRPAFPPAVVAVGREANLQRLPALPFPHGRTAGLEPAASLCCFPVSRRHPSQGIGANLVRFLGCCGAATPRGFPKPVEATVNHLPLAKVDGDDLGHFFTRHVVPAQRGSVEEQQ